MAIDREEQRLGTFTLARNVQRMMAYVRGTRLLLAVCVVLSVAQASLEMSLPLIVRYGLDQYIMPLTRGAGSQAARAQGPRSLVLLALAYALILIVNLALTYGVALGLNHIGQKAVLRLRAELWRHLHRLPVRYFDENPVGRLVTRVTNDTATLSDLFSSVLASAISDVVLFAGILVILVRLDAGLALRLFLLAPPLVLLAWWFKTYSHKLYRVVRVQVARLNTFLQEAVTGIVVLKTFVREKHASARFAALNQDYFRTQMRLIHLFAVFRPVIDAFAMSATALVIWFGGTQVLEHQLSVGTLVAFLLYLRMLFMPLQDLAEKFNILQSSVVASERLFKILDTPAEPSGRVLAPPARERGVVFEHVSFAYEPGVPVLQDVSFRIPEGKTVALVGPTGSGKTTIASLLLRFYEISDTDGAIRIDGVPIKHWDSESLRRRFALVQQDIFLFSGSLQHNVTLFDDVAASHLVRAVETSRLGTALEHMRNGLAHTLNERGTVLSQGERQLVAFARALAHPGEALILDEATASIDSQTEALIQQALRDLLKNRTALIIAHRLSTVQEADVILVLKRGRIVEQGTHRQLLAQGGLYSHLYATQFAA